MTPQISRRERPAKAALSRAGIIAAAVGILQREGFERVTMRRLADELDTGPASLYVYVRNADELRAAVLDELLRDVELAPVTAPGDWQERIGDVLQDYTMVLFDYPSLAQAALVSRPCGPAYLALLEGLLALLHEGGVPDDRAAWGVDLLLQFATATAVEHGALLNRTDENDDEDVMLGTALRGADPGSHPRIAALVVELMSGEPLQRLRWGFQVLIAGMLHTPRP